MSRRNAPAKGTAASDTLPIVSLIGRPNVGKSSLFNRLVGGRPALVEDQPGVTRDRRYGLCEWGAQRWKIVDTGGLDPSAEGILGAMRGQTLRAVDEAAVLVFVVDAKEGVTPVDTEVARLLRRTGKPIVVAANKVDSSSRERNVAEVHRLGFPQVFPLSATHGRGVGDLLDAIGALLASHPTSHRPSDPDDQLDDQTTTGGTETDEVAPIRLAFVGKPNVGKSSLVNRLLGEERVLVHDQPGTTRDPIDTAFRAAGHEFVLVDTAGLRRRRSVDTLTEAVAGKMARDQVARADVAALIIDAREGATVEDAKLASHIEASGRGALIVLNKADLVPRSQIDDRIASTREQLKFMAYAPLVITSALTGRAVADVPAAAVRVFTEWSRRVPTADLNRHFEEMVRRRPPPSGPSGKHVRLYYATQTGTCPPTFFVSSNAPTAVPDPYRRYLTNQFREIYGFAGSPLRLALRAKKPNKKGAPPA